MKTRNSEVLADFVAYCEANPDQRFWQALRNWADVGNWVLVTSDEEALKYATDTFYWERRSG